MRTRSVDRTFLIISLLLIVFGFTIFLSASLGLLTKGNAEFQLVALKQLIIGMVLGTGALYFFSRIDYRLLRTYSLYAFLFSLFLTLLVFVPGLGFEHGGARRWLSIGSFTFQPSELLRLSFIVYFAAWLSMVKDRVKTFTLGLMPFLILSGITGGVLLLQPDTDTFLTLFMAAFAMFIIAGARFRDILLLFFAGIAGACGLILMRPYLKERLFTFLNLGGADYYGAGYQIHQSLIAIGSGGIFGKGFGQSVQKFGYLPEPMGDSIFAVAGEEFGFIGASILIILFVMFALRGLHIAKRAPDTFSGLLGLGIVILIISQVFLNIASMLALFPLSGTPLVFVSQGGTALLIALAEVGILLNISRHQRT
jgi:cell division protein FtsW